MRSPGTSCRALMSRPVGTQNPDPSGHWAETWAICNVASSRQGLAPGSPVATIHRPVFRILAGGGEGAGFRDDRGQVVVTVDGAGGLCLEEEAGADDLGPVEGIAGFEVVDLLMGADGLLEIPLVQDAGRAVA